MSNPRKKSARELQQEIEQDKYERRQLREERLHEAAQDLGTTKDTLRNMEDWEEYPGHKEDNCF